MKYKLINWIKTEKWEGALIEKPDGKQLLTNGLIKWELAPNRKFEITPSIDTTSFMKWWEQYFPYDTLEHQLVIQAS